MFDVEEACYAFGAPRDETLAVLTSLVEAGFLTQDHDAFSPTDKLSQLAIASISHGIARGTADALLGLVIQKAKEINKDPAAYGGRILSLSVFGSYLTEKQVLGDLDIAFECEDVHRRNTDARKKYVSTALLCGKPNLISAHTLEEVIRLGTPYRKVFTA